MTSALVITPSGLTLKPLDSAFAWRCLHMSATRCDQGGHFTQFSDTQSTVSIRVPVGIPTQVFQKYQDLYDHWNQRMPGVLLKTPDTLEPFDDTSRAQYDYVVEAGAATDVRILCLLAMRTQSALKVPVDVSELARQVVLDFYSGLELKTLF